MSGRRTGLAVVGAIAALVAVAGPARAQVDPRPEKRMGVVTDVAGALVVDSPRARFDDAYQLAGVTHRFAFRNRGEKAVAIEQALALAPGGTVEVAPRVVPPGGAGEIVVRQALGETLGLVTYRYALVTDEPGVSRYRVLLTGFVQSAYEPERALLDLGVVDAGTGGAATLELFSREVSRLEVAEISGVPDGVRVRIDERAGDLAEGVRVRVELTPGGPFGARFGGFRLRTNVPNQPVYDVAFRANVFGDLVPSEHPVVLGLANEGQRVSRTVELASRSGRPVAVERAEDPTRSVQVDLAPCAEPRPSCVALRLHVDAARKGGLNGTVLVYEKGSEEPIPLTYTGLVVSAEKVIKSVELHDLAAEAGPQAAEPTPPAAPGAAPRPTEAPRLPAPTAAPSAGARQAVLRWVAREETDVYGYLVYRSARREGPFTRINSAIVPAVTGDGQAHAYELVDREVEPGTTYFYYLDLVTRGGAKKRFSGVVEKRVPAEPAGAPPSP
jgi:hypothetical protein